MSTTNPRREPTLDGLFAEWNGPVFQGTGPSGTRHIYSQRALDMALADGLPAAEAYDHALICICEGYALGVVTARELVRLWNEHGPGKSPSDTKSLYETGAVFEENKS